MGLNSYTFTDSDTSMSFFQKAREVFADHADRMEFWKLDVTNENQGFKPHSYNIVITSSVLHATTKLVKTMTNFQLLLKPGNKMGICEATCKECNCTSYLFGFLPN